MLGHAPFYHSHIKRYVAIFGTLFNDISIIREGKNGDKKTIKVPLSFVHKDKVLERLQQNPNLKETWNNSFPRMAFEMDSPTYDGTRKEGSSLQTMRKADGTKARFQFSPAPYTIPFRLVIFSVKLEDGLQVLEQILPFFQPEYTVSAREIPDMGIDRDIHVVLNSVSFTDNVEGDFTESRLIEWTLDFSLKGYFYGPVADKSIIKTIDINHWFNPQMEGVPAINYHAEGIPPDTITERITEN